MEGMPDNLVLVRHGNSDANVLQALAKEGDYSRHTESMVTVPDRTWRLSPDGLIQAPVAGAWLNSHFSSFDRYIVSPYVRTRETAGSLQLTHARWEENRAVRERNWGQIGSRPLKHFEERWPESAAIKRLDPLYWQPPGGESIANVADMRVRALANTIYRDNEKQNVVIVTHGEFIQATMLFFERWSDEEYLLWEHDKTKKIHNCTVVHFTRVNPETGERVRKLMWRRLAWPVLQEDGSWLMHEDPWVYFDRKRYSNEELLRGVDVYPQLR